MPKEVSTLCKVISVQRNDTYPTVVQEKSHVEISCKQMHSIHILPLNTQVGDLRTIGLEFCSGILKVSQYIYIFDFIKKALHGMQQSEKGEKIAIGIKMPLKLIFSLYL